MSHFFSPGEMAQNNQREASNPQQNVWVSASAGSGKTKTLTDRVLRLLLEGNQLSSILCLTFTNAAANEMEERVRARLQRWIIIEGEDLAWDLERLCGSPPTKEMIEKAPTLYWTSIYENFHIYTIHGFCQKLLAYCNGIEDVPHAFKLADDTESQRLAQKALDEMFYGEEELALPTLMKHMSYFTFVEMAQKVTQKKSLFQDILSAHDFTRLQENIAEWLGYSEELSQDIDFSLGDMQELLKQVALYGTATEKKRAESLLKGLPHTVDLVELLYPLFYTTQDAERKTVVSKALEKNAPQTAQQMIALKEKMAVAIERRNIDITYNASVELLTFVQDFLVHYAKQKERANVLDYEDLVLKTVQILEQADFTNWLMFLMDQKIHHVLVDEAQDTNWAQWKLINALTQSFFEPGNKHRTLFVVGDHKQAIYSFQGTAPNIFKHLQQFFTQLPAPFTFKDISMDVSFRSYPAIMHFVNKVFNRTGALNNEEMRHVAFRDKTEGRVEIWPLAVEDEEAEVTANEKLARKMAGTIDGWLQDKRMLKGLDRVIQPEDIYILCRQRGELFFAIEEALKKRNVPLAPPDRFYLTDHTIYKELLAFAKWALNSRDDYALYCALHSPVFAHDHDELYKLAINREGTLWEQVQHEETRAKLEEIKALSVLPASVFFYEILERYGEAWRKNWGQEYTQVREYFTAFVDRFEQMEGHPTLMRFVIWQSKQAPSERQEAQGAQGVRISTIHGAKGLQAPVVFLPDTVQMPQFRPDWVHDIDRGIFAFCPKAAFMAEPYKHMYNDEKQLLKEEYYRLLYVAMTRAEEELYIAGASKRDSVPQDCWYALIERSLEASAD